MLNRIILIGRLTRDVCDRYTPGQSCSVPDYRPVAHLNGDASAITNDTELLSDEDANALVDGVLRSRRELVNQMIVESPELAFPHISLCDPRVVKNLCGLYQRQKAFECHANKIYDELCNESGTRTRRSIEKFAMMIAFGDYAAYCGHMLKIAHKEICVFHLHNFVSLASLAIAARACLGFVRSSDGIYNRPASVFWQLAMSGTLIATNLYFITRERNKLSFNEKQVLSGISPAPPRWAEYLLYFLPKKTRDPLLGDLAEQYQEVHAKFGKFRAYAWYCYNVLEAFGPLLRLALGWILKSGIVKWLMDIVKSNISG